MASINSSPLSTRQIQQALQRGVKDVLTANGIQPSTRRGNKELDLAVQRLAQQPYSTLEEAAQTGEALGQKIVELSQAKGKTDLDGGIVRQMMLTGEIPTVVKVTAKPAKTTPVLINAAPKAASPVSAPPAAAKVEAAVNVEANAPVELEAMATLEPAAIAAPDPEPVVAANREAVAAVEAITPAAIDVTPSPTEAIEATLTDKIQPIETEPKAVGTAK